MIYKVEPKCGKDATINSTPGKGVLRWGTLQSVLVNGEVLTQSPYRSFFICQRGGTVYTADLKSAARKGLRVRIPPLAPSLESNMFGGVPASLLMDIARQNGCYTQLELDLGCPPFYFIDPKYMCDVFNGIRHYSPDGQQYGTICYTDHPAWATLRSMLENKGYIKTERSWSNGDRVIKPFYLNNFLLIEGDKFCCAAAAGNDKKLTENYNDGKIDPTVKNYRPEDEFYW